MTTQLLTQQSGIPTLFAMPNSPNLKISKWFRQIDLLRAAWVRRAVCGGRQDLPWVPDTGTPTSRELERMYEVCASCPVLHDCAQYALVAGGDGGFYAGVWIPTPGSADAMLIRRYARSRLRRLAR